MVSSWQYNYNKSRHAQRHDEAQRLVVLTGSDLQRAVGQATWTQSKNPFYAGIAICGISTLGIAYFVATRPYSLMA